MRTGDPFYEAGRRTAENAENAETERRTTEDTEVTEEERGVLPQRPRRGHRGIATWRARRLPRTEWERMELAGAPYLRFGDAARL
jgi:hypothetical protein